MTLRVYGIKNCNTMKRAFAWLEAKGVDYAFHDYKKAGIDATTLARWCAQVGWQALVNTRGTTWRRLEPARQAIAGEADAIRLMGEHPSLIRRPVVEAEDGTLIVGFEEDALARQLAPNGEAA